MDVVETPIDKVVPYARNPRRNDDAIATVAASLAEFGWRQPIVVDEKMVILAGHTRYEAAKRLGMTVVPVHVAKGLSAAQARAYRLMDNRSHQNAAWDDDLLKLELDDLRLDDFDLTLTGFSDEELGRLLSSLDGEEQASQDTSGEDADETPEPPRDPVSQQGDLWSLGEHRLLCGDATDAASVARLMAGDKATLLFTSPPYGNQRDYTTGGVGDWDDLMRGVFAHVPLLDGGQVLVNLGLIHRDNEWQPYWDGWIALMREHGWRRFGLYAWDQGPGLPGDWNGRLAPSFEFVFHFNRQARKPNKIVPCKWAGHVNDAHGGMRNKDGSVGEWTHAGQGVQDMRIPDNVIRITRHKARGIETEHPAVFPVKLPEFVMNAYSNAGEIVYDPFSGSGTTIVAGEKTGRRVRAIELAPEYADVALLRWRDLFPDKVPMLDGKSFDGIAAERGVRVRA
jgi:DNA modification methylase